MTSHPQDPRPEPRPSFGALALQALAHAAAMGLVIPPPHAWPVPQQPRPR